jgi:PAS domain-containing protein
MALYPVLLSLIMILAPFQTGYYASFSFHFPFLGALAGMVFVSARAAAREKKPVLYLLSFGYLNLLAGAGLDFAYMLGFVELGYTMPVAIFIYLLLYTVYLAHNFSSAFRRTEERRRELPPQNLSLEKEISERKKAESQLQNVFNILSHLFDTLEDGIVLISTDRKILMANQSFYSMFDISPAHTADCGIFFGPSRMPHFMRTGLLQRYPQPDRPRVHLCQKAFHLHICPVP